MVLASGVAQIILVVYFPPGFVFTSPGPIFIQFGPLTVRWYGLLIASAVVIGTFLSQWVARFRYGRQWHRELAVWMDENFGGRRSYWLSIVPLRLANFDRLGDIIYDLVFWLIIGAIPGARAYYVAFSWENYQNAFTTLGIGSFQISIPSAFAVWQGGIAIHGAILGGSLALILFAKSRRISAWQLADAIAPSLILGQAIGRWGNFFNSEAFGSPTQLPWKLYISPANRPPAFASEAYFHPTFLYESVWNVGVLSVLMFLLWRYPNLKDGTLVWVYMVAYSAGRLWIEGLRMDSLLLGPLRIAQLVSIVAIIVGLVGLGRLYGKRYS